jgi:hypothetical protein
MASDAGKGDKYRPVKKNLFDENYDSINWSKKKVVKVTSDKENKKNAK